MNKNWEKDAEYGSDILGTGSYQFIHGGSDKSKTQAVIGFVRPKQKNERTNKNKNPKARSKADRSR